MASSRRRVSTGGTLFLDSQGLALYLGRDRVVMSKVAAARRRGANVAVSGVTLLEAHRSDVKRPHWEYVLSQLDVLPMSVAWFREATDLLGAVGLHGHKYAIDAMVAVTALKQPGPVVILTSDVDDMSQLCGPRVVLEAL
ncbi:type II toxin-antitoxin system VapC family toxin [Streptomyces vinaceus]|uniref:type II toxin-antitoxin system VapC family toxin n=1 Tax=Streptomyces vinaceus TaxID=1960 RepID=UPI0036ABABB2